MDKFIRLWILSILLLFSGLCVIYAGMKNPEIIGFLLALNVLNVYGELLILRICCLVCKYQYKTYWEKYGLVLLIYSFSMMFIEASANLVVLPFQVFQILIVTVITLIILVRWHFSNQIKFLAILIFGVFGVFRVYESASISSPGIVERMLVDMAFLVALNIVFAILFYSNMQIENRIREGYMKDMVEKAVDIVFYYTLKPYPAFLFVSPSVEQIVGYKQVDFYKNPNLYLEITHEEDRKIIEQAFSAKLGDGTKNFVRWQRKDGEFIYLEYYNNPIVENGKIVAIGGILRDITDRKMAEKDMLEVKKEKQLFQSYISHELRTPITYIMGYTEMLQKDFWESETERSNAVNLINSKAMFLKTLVDDLFQLSKMESNQFAFEFIQISVKELFDILDKTYENDVCKAGIGYNSIIDARVTVSAIEVLADVKRIEQVYVNILQNAVKYAPESETIKFECQIDDNHENILFKITDMGNGISKEDQLKIFEPFYRSESARARDSGGSGIGLSLCRLIMRSHNGDIYVNSKKGYGSEFVFSLPIYLEG